MDHIAANDVVENVDETGIRLDVEARDFDGGQHHAHLRPAGAEKVSTDIGGSFPIAHVHALAHPARLHAVIERAVLPREILRDAVRDVVQEFEGQRIFRHAPQAEKRLAGQGANRRGAVLVLDVGTNGTRGMRATFGEIRSFRKFVIVGNHPCRRLADGVPRRREPVRIPVRFKKFHKRFDQRECRLAVRAGEDFTRAAIGDAVEHIGFVIMFSGALCDFQVTGFLKPVRRHGQSGRGDATRARAADQNRACLHIDELAELSVSFPERDKRIGEASHRRVPCRWHLHARFFHQIELFDRKIQPVGALADHVHLVGPRAVEAIAEKVPAIAEPEEKPGRRLRALENHSEIFQRAVA